MRRLAFISFISACADPGAIEVAQNRLAITSLEAAVATDRYELHGLDADGAVVARLDVRLGAIESFGDLPELGNQGSEIVVAVAGQEQRFVSREMHHLVVEGGADVTSFLTLPEVLAITTRWDTVVTATPPVAPSERAYVAGCSPSTLNTTPVAKQCCWSYSLGDNSQGSTVFFAGSGVNQGSAITRYGPSTPCRAIDGGPCSGANCYYGPNGFSKAVIRPPTKPYSGTLVFDDGETNQYCAATFWDTPITPMFGDVTGTFPTGQGCPGGNTGGTLWDY